MGRLESIEKRADNILSDISIDENEDLNFVDDIELDIVFDENEGDFQIIDDETVIKELNDLVSQKEQEQKIVSSQKQKAKRIEQKYKNHPVFEDEDDFLFFIIAILINLIIFIPLFVYTSYNLK